MHTPGDSQYWGFIGRSKRLTIQRNFVPELSALQPWGLDTPRRNKILDIPLIAVYNKNL